MYILAHFAIYRRFIEDFGKKMMRDDLGNYVIFGLGGQYNKYDHTKKLAADQNIYRDRYGNELVKNKHDYVCTNTDGHSCVMDGYDYCALLNDFTLFVYKREDPPTCQIIDCETFKVITDFITTPPGSRIPDYAPSVITEKSAHTAPKFSFNNGILTVSGVHIRTAYKPIEAGKFDDAAGKWV